MTRLGIPVNLATDAPVVPQIEAQCHNTMIAFETAAASSDKPDNRLHRLRRFRRREPATTRNSLLPFDQPARQIAGTVHQAEEMKVPGTIPIEDEPVAKRPADRPHT